MPTTQPPSRTDSRRPLGDVARVALLAMVRGQTGGPAEPTELHLPATGATHAVRWLGDGTVTLDVGDPDRAAYVDALESALADLAAVITARQDVATLATLGAVLEDELRG